MLKSLQAKSSEIFLRILGLTLISTTLFAGGVVEASVGVRNLLLYGTPTQRLNYLGEYGIREVTTTTGGQVVGHTKVIPHFTYSGCWGPFNDTHTYQDPTGSVNLAWERLTVGGWCWRNGAVTHWGGVSVSRWSAFAYCWNNTSGPSEWWYHNPTWVQAAIGGEFGVNTGFGCIGVHGDYDKVGYGRSWRYENGGWNWYSQENLR